MSHFWPREKNWSTETRKKVVLVWFTNRGLGNGFCDTSGDQCQIKRALFLHMVSCGRISCQCTESEKQSMIIFVCFLLGNSPASELCVYIYIYINIYIYRGGRGDIESLIYQQFFFYWNYSSDLWAACWPALHQVIRCHTQQDILTGTSREELLWRMLLTILVGRITLQLLLVLPLLNYTQTLK